MSASAGRAFQSAFFSRNPLAQNVLELFDALPNVAFYAKDVESRFVRMNGLFLEIHGCHSDEQMLGKSDRDVSPPVMAEAYIEEDQRVMAARQTLAGQVWLVYHPREQPNWYISTKTPLFNDAGEVIGIAGAMYLIERSDDLAAHTRELLPVVKHIEQHYTEPVSMTQMARLAGLSATHFNRRFRQILRMTPLEYLRTVRVQAARRLLARSSAKLADIAVDTGFTDQSHFTRRFREATGMTPAAYRMRFRRAP
ncbi:AraC family transcriptional regulator [Humisphaera borealis]|uniref:AraC family transcriptional regulator n=1 Tax=Humisphaera borealis TaxID=2807512 RepID=A0A7M2WU80_9BACT|nr:AraC family transcriptional regulator [Humisphaera borealis]QOV88824.1 AraC family transcriptional regulator [Humisphaera borealis]